MQPRIDKHTYFLKIAELVALRSTCPRRQVGCVVINSLGHILATGYNGVPKNYPHCIDTFCGGENFNSSTALNKCMATHAEQNALLQCNSINNIDTIYCTTSPCITCAKLIGNTSCKTVIYSNTYKDNSGIKMLNELNINTIHHKI